MVPFPPLTKLAAHEQGLFARFPVHITQKQPEVGEFLPIISGHLGQKGGLPVHHLIVGEGQDEIFMKGVQEGKGQLVHVVTAVNRILGHEGQHVMHPAHVPLEHEAQAP